MSQLAATITEQVVTACRENADEAAAAFGRALGGEISCAVGETEEFDAAAMPKGLDDRPGLAIVLTFGEVGAVALLPEATGLLPDWYAAPDPTGKSKLSTLAQELSMLLVPDDLVADKFEAGRVKNMQAALALGGIADATVVLLRLTRAATGGTLYFLWPLSSPDNMLSSTPAEDPAAVPPPAAPISPPQPPISLGPLADGDFRRLPAYAQSLLKVQVPVVVHLASKRQPIRDIVEIVPGSIVNFEKSCDEMLEMCIGDRQIAEGEVVKVGEKFGLRITAITMPEERFNQVYPSAPGRSEC